MFQTHHEVFNNSDTQCVMLQPHLRVLNVSDTPESA